MMGNHIRTFWRVMLVLLITAKLLLVILGEYYHFYLLGEHSNSFIDLLLILLLLLNIVGKQLIVKVMLVIGAIFYTLYSIISFMHYIDNKEYTFSSPRGTHIIILEEDVLLTATQIRVYEKKYSIFKKLDPTVYISSGEPVRPITDGTYNIEWLNEKEVKIHCYGPDILGTGTIAYQIGE